MISPLLEHVTPGPKTLTPVLVQGTRTLTLEVPSSCALLTLHPSFKTNKNKKQTKKTMHESYRPTLGESLLLPGARLGVKGGK